MTDTLTKNPFTTEEVTKAALEAAQRNPNFWVGYSGETITGAETAAFLQATREVLEKHGWVRTYRDAPAAPDPEFPKPDESLSVKQMILALWRYAREAMAQGQDRGPLTLMSALCQVGDQDVHCVATGVLNALMAAHTGTRTAQATVWAERTSRTWDEVRDLLDAGTDFARAHSPS